MERRVSYGQATEEVDVVSKGTFNATVTGLSYNQTYHYRAVAHYGTSYWYGSDKTFMTLAALGSSTDLRIISAKVFSNYIATGDYVFVVEYQNTYTGYYPSESAKESFTIQLIDTDNTTILAASPQQDWRDKPGSIYLNATQAAGLTYGSNYYIRLQANFSASVLTQYQLRHLTYSDDWKGSDLVRLDDWCLGVAWNMQTYSNATGYTVVLTDRKLAITDSVGGYFTSGIPGIAQVRPNLFTTSQQHPTFDAGVSGLPADNTTAYVAYVGTPIATDAATLAVPLGLTARDILGGLIVLAMLGVVMTGVSAMGGFGALGLFLISVPLLWLGTYFKILGVQWVMVLTFIFGFFAIRQFIIKTT